MSLAWVIILVATFLSLCYLFRNNIAGDSMIHLIYGRNLAHGRVMQFNEGEVSFGSSSITWSATSAIPYLVQSDDYTAIYIQKALSLLVFCVTIAWLRHAKFFRVRESEYVVLFVLWFGLSKFLQFATVGMETALAILLLLCVVNNAFVLFGGIQHVSVAALGPRNAERIAPLGLRFLVGGMLAGLLVLTRLELSLAPVFVLALLALATWYWGVRDSSVSPARRKGLWPGLCLTGLYALGIGLTVAPFFGSMYWLTESFVPNSVASRLYLTQSNPVIPLIGGLKLNLKLLAFGLVNGLLLVAACVALFSQVWPGVLRFVSGPGRAGGGASEEERIDARFFTTLLCIAIIGGVGGCFLLLSAGFQGGRYFMPVFALIVVWAAKGIVVGTAWIGARGWLAPRLGQVAVVGIALLAHGVFNYLLTPITLGSLDGVSLADRAQFIKSNVPAGKSILIYEVQIKLHLTEYRVLSEDGVTDGRILRYYEKYGDSARAVDQFMLNERPDYVIAGFPRDKLTPRIRGTVLSELQMLAQESSLGEQQWLSDRIGAKAVYDLASNDAREGPIEKIFQMSYR